MEFFSSLPTRPEPDDDDDDPEIDHEPPAWYGPPSSVLGAPVGISGVVYRSEHLFVGLRYATVYPSGVSFGIRVALRRGDWPRERWEDLDGLIFGSARRRVRPSDDDGDLMIGVELAGGTRTSTTSNRRAWAPRDQAPEAPVLTEHGGGGSGGSRYQHSSRDLWLWPLPDGDTLDLVFAWPALDMPVTRYTIDAKQFRAAVASTAPYWG
jgi:hypothetical protein